MRYHFGRPSRLAHKRDFTRVFQAPLRIADRSFVLLARPNALGHARLGLAVSRRVSRRAVDRNRIKRLVRESFRHQQSLVAVDIVIVAKPGSSDLPSAQLRTSLTHLWLLLDRRVRAQQQDSQD